MRIDSKIFFCKLGHPSHESHGYEFAFGFKPSSRKYGWHAFGWTSKKGFWIRYPAIPL